MDWKSRSPLAEAPEPAILMLAPMEGISDDIVRELFSAIGGMDLAVTEFIRVSRRVLSKDVLLRECPELKDGGRTPSGTPVLVQLLGGEPDLVAESARLAADLGALGIDLNFGCPAKKVNGSDGGAVLLKEPHRITDVVAATKKACPKDVTVSAKIRLGWEDPSDVVACAKAAEAGGADWITIHARTKIQMYKPHADWTRIADARREVKIPVVANGDIFDREAFERCGRVTGSTAFMLGRGAFRTPNLFRILRGFDRAPWSTDRLVDLLATFAERVLRHGRYDDPRRAALNRIKGWTGAMAEASLEMAAAFERLKRTQALEDALRVLENSCAPVSARALPVAVNSFLP